MTPSKMEVVMNKVMKLYGRCTALPVPNSVARWIFSRIICYMAPYFRTIKPLFLELRPCYSRVLLKRRWSVTNHLGTVHAIAMCNLAEYAAGIMLEASIPPHLRWIPKGMTVSYQKIAKGSVVGICEILPEDMVPGELPMTVSVRDENKDEVFKAVITMHLSERKKR